MLYIKSVNTLNHNTWTFASRSILLISNNSNWIGALGAKSLWGWKGWNTNPKELKGRLLFTRDIFVIFQNFTLKIKFISVLKLINKSHNIRHLHLSHNTPCLSLNLCIGFVFYDPSGSHFIAGGPKRNYRQCLYKILGGKQGVLFIGGDVKMAD